MSRLDYQVSAPIGHRTALGLVVLQADETVEPEFRRLIGLDGVALYVTRIASGADVTPETLTKMEAALPASAALLPPSLEFGVIGYACTSGATVIGSESVAKGIRRGARTGHVTDALMSVKAAARALGASRLGFVTPYRADVSAAMRAALEKDGIEIAGFGSFEEASEARVARIDPRSAFDAALTVGRAAECDAVFLSCTNLRTLDIIEAAETELGKPVITSNQALAWNMLRLAGIADAVPGAGRLMRL